MNVSDQKTNKQTQIKHDFNTMMCASYVHFHFPTDNYYIDNTWSVDSLYLKYIL